jgi:TRAP transporter TAXI family solute receptor
MLEVIAEERRLCNAGALGRSARPCRGLPAWACAIGVLGLTVVVGPAPAQEAPASTRPAQAAEDNAGELVQIRHALRARENAGVVGFVAGDIGSTDLRVAGDLATVLDGGEHGLRVLPVAGKGSLQNVKDIVLTRGIDVGIVQADVMAYYKREPLFLDLENYLCYITKLYDEEVHVLAAKEIGSLQDLAGKKVNFDAPGSGTEITAQVIFTALAIPVEATRFDTALALAKLSEGEIAALVYVAGKPAPLFERLRPDDGLHFLAIAATPDLGNTYTPATLTPRDYPSLIEEGRRVDTVAVGAVMVAYNWPPGTERYHKVARFVDGFFDGFKDLRQSPRHPKWRQIDLAAPVPGWTRFPPAEKRLRSAALAPIGGVQSAGAGAKTALDFDRTDALFQEFSDYLSQQQIALFKDFTRYLAELRVPAIPAAAAAPPLDPATREALFKEFVEQQKRVAGPLRVATAPPPEREGTE